MYHVYHWAQLSYAQDSTEKLTALMQSIEGEAEVAAFTLTDCCQYPIHVT